MKLKVQAPLDAGFAPMELIFREYARDVETCGKQVPIAVNVERNQGYCDYLAMDIKSSPENYALACGAEGVAEKVFRTADMLMSGDLPFEFRTTLVRGIHTASDMRSIADRLAGNERFFLQNYENSGEIISPAGLDGFTAEETEAFARILREKIPNAAVRSQ